MGKVEFTCLARHNLRLMEPPLVAEVEANAEVVRSVFLPYVTQDTALGYAGRRSLSPKHSPRQEPVSVLSNATDDVDALLSSLDRLELEDAPISNQLHLRICGVCEAFRRKVIRRHSPSIHAHMCMGMNEVEYYEQKLKLYNNMCYENHCYY